jgi:uncharacterized protein (DUF433 family)
MALNLDAEPVPLGRDADGVIRVGGTRVTLDTVVGAYLDGATADAIAEQYPSLSPADVYTAIGFYLRHRSDVEAYLCDRSARAELIRRDNELRAEPSGVRARLLTRRPTGEPR